MLVSATATYFDATLVNVGPLTSTFTPPPSCTYTPRYNVQLQGQGQGDDSVFYRTQCDGSKPSRVSQCRPSESALVNEPVASYSNDDDWITYYSPGLACPSGFTTVGAAVVGQGLNNVTQSGQMFASTEQPSGVFQQLPIASYFCDNMQPSETAVFCCPTGYTGKYLGGCASTVTSKKAEELGITTACIPVLQLLTTGGNVTSLHGRTYSPPLPLPDVLGTTLSVEGYPIPLPSATGTQSPISVVAVEDIVQMVILVHKDEELKGLNTSDGKSGASAAQPSLYNVAAAVPFALAIGAVLSGIFVL